MVSQAVRRQTQPNRPAPSKSDFASRASRAPETKHMPSRKHLLLIIGDRQELIESCNWERLDRLKQLCQEGKIPVQHIESSKGFALDSLPSAVGCRPSIIVCGKACEEQIVETCKILREATAEVIVAIDCLESTDGSPSRICEELERKLCQLSLTEAIISLLRNKTSFVYAYPKADVAASVVVLFEKSDRVVLVKRKFEPFKGCFGLPGGFLRPLLEDLPACAARELEEETGLQLSPGDLTLVSVRSSPSRDRRGHVIDSGYYAVIKPHREAAALSQLKALDDAAQVVVVPVSLAMRMPLAADHGSLLADAVRMAAAGKLARQWRLRRWLDECILWMAGPKPIPQMIASWKNY